MCRAFPGSDYYGGSVSVEACRLHTCRTLTGSVHAFPCCVRNRQHVGVDALYPPVPAPCRLDNLGESSPTSPTAPLDQRAILLLDQAAGRLSLTRSSSISSEFALWRRVNQAFTFVRHAHTQPCGQGSNWTIARSRLFPGLQTTGGIVPVACLVRLRFGRNLAPFGALPHTLHARIATHTHTAHGRPARCREVRPRGAGPR